MSLSGVALDLETVWNRDVIPIKTVIKIAKLKILIYISLTTDFSFNFFLLLFVVVDILGPFQLLKFLQKNRNY